MKQAIQQKKGQCKKEKANILNNQDESDLS